MKTKNCPHVLKEMEKDGFYSYEVGDWELTLCIKCNKRLLKELNKQKLIENGLEE